LIGKGAAIEKWAVRPQPSFVRLPRFNKSVTTWTEGRDTLAAQYASSSLPLEVNVADITRQLSQQIENDINRDAKNVPRLILDVEVHMARAIVNGDTINEKVVAQAAEKALVQKGLLKDVEVEDVGVIQGELVFKTKRNDYAVLGRDGKQKRMFVLPLSDHYDPTVTGNKTEVKAPDGSSYEKENGVVTRAGIESPTLGMQRTFHRDAARNVDQVTYDRDAAQRNGSPVQYTEHWHKEGADTWVEDQGTAPDRRRTQKVDVDDYGNMRVTRNGVDYLSLPNGREIVRDQAGNPLSNCIDFGAETRACIPSMPQSDWILRLDRASYLQVDQGIAAIGADASARSAKSMTDAVGALKNLKAQQPSSYEKLEDSMREASDFPRLSQLRTELAFRKASGDAYFDGAGDLSRYSKRISNDDLDLGAFALENLLVAKGKTQESINETKARTGQKINDTVVKASEADDLKKIGADVDAKLALLNKSHDMRAALQKLSTMSVPDLNAVENQLTSRVIDYERNPDLLQYNRDYGRQVEAKLARDSLLFVMAAQLHNKKNDPLLALITNGFYTRAKALEPNNPDFVQLDQILRHGLGTGKLA